MRKNNKFIIFILILFISIGFAYLSTNLYINGTSIVKRTTWSVYFDNVNNESTTGEINTNASISTDKKEVDFEITFDKPGDTYTFNVDVVNDGTLDAMLESFKIEGLDEQTDYMNWYVLYDDGIRFSKYDLLKAGTTEKILITVSIKEDVDIDYLPTTEVVSSNLKFTANYVQADQNGKERERRTYNIRYNLDGGTISNNPTTYNSRLGATIPNPTKQGYTFAGWTGGKNLFKNYPDNYTSNGIDIYTDSDGTINYSGTLTGNDGWFNLGYKNSKYDIPMGTYTYSTTTSKDYTICLKGNLSENNTVLEKRIPVGENSITFTTTSKYSYYAYIHYFSNNVGYIEDTLNLQLEEGNKATEYEPYISEPVTDIVLSPGATGNRTYTANWIEN